MPDVHALHVCLVSEQTTPNVTPILDPSMAPREVALVVSPGMMDRAEWIEAVVRRRGVKARRWLVTDPWDIELLRDELYRYGESIEDADAVLNATGGTKPMSIAAFELFRTLDKPVFYVHPERDRVVWLYPGERGAYDLADRIHLADFLAVHGVELIDAETGGMDERLRALGKDLVAGVDRFSDPLGVLNALAAEAEPTLQSSPISPAKRDWADLQDLMDRFSEAGVLDVADFRLRFPDEASRFLVNGGWLEQHVFDAVRDLRREQLKIQDVARGVRVRRSAGSQPVDNELDVALIADNRLYVIECKTSRMTRPDQQARATDALFRLEILREKFGGLNARGMLVSYHALQPADLRRAADLRIETCAGRALVELPSRLRRWIAAS